VDFEDFAFYRMDLVDVYYVGGFGVMGWVSASDYETARPDPLADAATGIIQHMNADHRDALILLARMFGGVESQEATMTAVDRLGFHVRLKTQDGMRGARIAFLREVGQPNGNKSRAGRNDAAGAANLNDEHPGRTTTRHATLLWNQGKRPDVRPVPFQYMCGG